MSNWIIRANTDQFRIHDFIRDYGFVEYSQKKPLQVGDIIYLYITRSSKRIEYKMVVERTNITPREAFDDWSYSKLPQRKPIMDDDRFVRFKNIKRVETNELCYKKLWEHGFHYSMQNDRELSDETVEYIERFFK